MMWPVNQCLGIGAIWADAVFVSGLQRHDEPSAGQVRQAVSVAIRSFGRSGCAGRVAQEFGDHPETAVLRMRWARLVAREAFAGVPPVPGLGWVSGGWPVISPPLQAGRASGSPGTASSRLAALRTGPAAAGEETR